MIHGISHITLIVRDLEKMKIFLESIFDAKEVYSSEKKQFSLYPEKFFLIGDVWIAIMRGEEIIPRTYNHIAFKISSSEFSGYRNKIIEMNLDIKKERVRIDGEGESLYFYDFDNHLFELHTGTLEERLEIYSFKE